MNLSESAEASSREGGAIFTPLESEDVEDDAYFNKSNSSGPPSAPSARPKLTTLQKSSLAFLPAALTTLTRAFTGTRLLTAHAWTCGVCALSLANHSRDYRRGPRLDALDIADKTFAWALGISCACDGLMHLPRWRFWATAPFALLTLALYWGARHLRAAEGEGPASSLRLRALPLTPEALHACMHAVAGAGAFLVVL